MDAGILIRSNFVTEALYRLDTFPICENSLQRAQSVINGQELMISNLNASVGILEANKGVWEGLYHNLNASHSAQVKKERLLWGGVGLGAGVVITAILVALIRK